MIETLTGWANNAPAEDFWRAAIILILGSSGGFIGAFYYLMRKRIIQDVPTSRIRSAAQGYVELAGRSALIPGKEIRAPLTGTVCSWFFYTIEEYRRSGKRSRWVTVELGSSDALFLLIDDTGQAVIDPEGASITPAVTDVWYGSSRQPDQSAVRPGGGWWRFTSGRYRYTEKRIHPGDPLYAIGLFNTTSGGTGYDIDNRVRVLLGEWKQDSATLLKQFDSNRDGEIDMEEWNRVRETALRQVMARHGEMKNFPSVHTMSDTRDLRRPYLLSAITEPRLVKKYNKNAGLCITAFFIAGILAVWLVGIRLGG